MCWSLKESACESHFLAERKHDAVCGEFVCVRDESGGEGSVIHPPFPESTPEANVSMSSIFLSISYTIQNKYN